ncbi:MAG: DUF4493 domain-containing protein [Alistipes sp.]|nr:DUF4493 domain-containing protein [Alistipes sp.]
MKHLQALIGALILLVAVSCTKNQVEGYGSVSFALDNNAEIVEQTRSNVSDYTTLPSAENFTITIKNASGEQSWSGLISEWVSSPIQLRAGNYTVEATYGSIEEEGFDKPYFYGTASFAVTGGQTTNVPITVSLGNTIIKVSYSDNFKAYFSDYTFKLTRDNTEIAVFAKDETRGAFIDGYKITVEGEMTGELKTFSYSNEYTNLEVATAYTLAFDVDNVGSATLTVTFNDEVETVELGDIELND